MPEKLKITVVEGEFTEETERIEKNRELTVNDIEELNINPAHNIKVKVLC